MKLTSLLCLCAIGLLLEVTAISSNAQLITGFGTSDFTPTDYSSFTPTATINDYRISGLDNGNYLSANIPNFNINSSITQLSLVGTIHTNPSSIFSITLQDSLYHQLIFAGTWSAFTSTNIEQTITLTRTSSYGSFNGIASVFILETGGSGQSLDITLNALSAVPEPTSMLLLGMGLAGIAMRRSLRRR